ncbi:chromate transporter [bacterium]|nr:chromate transporter [bacterium]
MKKSLYQIFKTFFKVGTLLLGGGYVILPLLQSELVEKRDWISDDELCEYYAISQSIPGIIAANVSIFTGYRLRKFWGALAAIIGLTLPAFTAIIILAKIVEEVTNLKFIQSIFWGVGIGVLVLIFLAIKEVWKKSVVDKFTCGVFFVAFIMSTCLKVPPAIIVILAIFMGIWLQFARKIELGERN